MSLTRKLAQAQRHLSLVDPVMGRLIVQHGRCGLGRRGGEPFHVLSMSIISQQLSTRAADTIAARVKTAVGAAPHFKAEHFAGASHDSLRACGLSNGKAKWLAALGAAAVSGELSFERLNQMDDEAAIGALDALPGIGRWTAEMFLMFAMDRLDLFAMDDVGLRRGVNLLYGNGRKLTDRKTLAIASRWAPYRSVASWYLWRAIEPVSPL
jgi:DNA-3-methyladenine glycosylase II